MGGRATQLCRVVITAHQHGSAQVLKAHRCQAGQAVQLGRHEGNAIRVGLVHRLHRAQSGKFKRSSRSLSGWSRC